MDRLTRITTALIVVVVVIVGAVVTLTDPDRLSFAAYLQAVATALGLLAVGYGIDAHSRP